MRRILSRRAFLGAVAVGAAGAGALVFWREPRPDPPSGPGEAGRPATADRTEEPAPASRSGEPATAGRTEEPDTAGRTGEIATSDPGRESDATPVTYVIAAPCIGVKDASCVEVCPVDCIYEGEDQYYIHPDECIYCGACEPECPVQAIFPAESLPGEWRSYIEKNRAHFARG